MHYQLHLNFKQSEKIFEMTYLGREDILKYRTGLTHPSMNTRIPLTQENLDYILCTEFPKKEFS